MTEPQLTYPAAILIGGAIPVLGTLFFAFPWLIPVFILLGWLINKTTHIGSS
jgi:hypothetical protein